jgi:molybdopterin-binding protein
VLDLDGGGKLVTTTPATGPVLAAVAPAGVSVSRQRPEGKEENIWPGQVSAVAARRRRRAVGLRRPVRCSGLPTMITTERNAMKLSARNQIPARVTGITAGEAIANVELDANGTRLVASITVEAVRQLGLKEGTDVIAVFKASEVILATGD